jgi:hypothetical protein
VFDASRVRIEIDDSDRRAEILSAPFGIGPRA